MIYSQQKPLSVLFFFSSLNKKLDRFANSPAISFFPGKICPRIVCLLGCLVEENVVKLTSEIQCLFYSLCLSVSKGNIFCLIGTFGGGGGGGGLTVHSLSSIRVASPS